MDYKLLIKVAGIIFISAVLGQNLQAQSRNDVIKAYNEGAKVIKTDTEAAITAFENAVTLADQVGETADDLKQKLTGALPSLYFKVANDALRANKPVQEVIQAAKRAIAASEKYNSATNKENSEKVMLQAYLNMASGFFNENDYDNALSSFDSALMVNPGYVAAIYNKALVYLRQNNVDEFEKSIDLYLEKLGSGPEDEKAKQASKTALEYFRAAGSKASQEENLDEALALLTKAEKYGEDKDLFYFFADVYNKQKKFDQAMEYAQKGLALETGDSEAKAKYYFQLGLAQKGKGQTSEACASFKNSLFGAFAEASKAERSNLKCQ